MRIEPATPEAVRAVAVNMRERDFLEFSAVSYAETRFELAEVLTARYGESADVHVGFEGLEPVCVGGSVMARPNVISLLFFATDRFPEIILPATRYIKKQLLPRLIEAGVHRIEAVSMAGHSEAHAWLRTLGLQKETGPMHGYGKRGEAFIQFAWSQHVCAFGA
jgi:hypothetical protein